MVPITADIGIVGANKRGARISVTGVDEDNGSVASSKENISLFIFGDQLIFFFFQLFPASADPAPMNLQRPDGNAGNPAITLKPNLHSGGCMKFFKLLQFGVYDNLLRLLCMQW